MLGSQIVEHLKRIYPNPVAAIDAASPDDEGGLYCVGGAVCLAVAHLRHINMPSDDYLSFPSTEQLANILCQFSPYMMHCRDRAEKAAERIINYNDEEKFEKAWSELEKVLNFAVSEQQPEEEKPKPVPAKITPRRQRLRAESQREISARRRHFEERGIRIRFRAQMRKAWRMK